MFKEGVNIHCSSKADTLKCENLCTHLSIIPLLTIIINNTHMYIYSYTTHTCINNSNSKTGKRATNVEKKNIYKLFVAFSLRSR